MNQNTADKILARVREAIENNEPDYVWQLYNKLIQWLPQTQEPWEDSYPPGVGARIRPQTYRGQTRGYRCSNLGSGSVAPTSGYSTYTWVPWRNGPGVTRPLNAGFNDLMPEHIHALGSFWNSPPCRDYKGQTAGANVNCLLKRYRPLPPTYRPVYGVSDSVLLQLIDTLRLILGYTPGTDWGTACWRSRPFFLGDLELQVRPGVDDEVSFDGIGSFPYVLKNTAVVWSMFWLGYKPYEDITYKQHTSLTNKKAFLRFLGKETVSNSQPAFGGDGYGYLYQYPQSTQPSPTDIEVTGQSLANPVTFDGWVLSCDMVFMANDEGIFSTPEFQGVRYTPLTIQEQYRRFTGSLNLAIFRPAAKRSAGNTIEPQIFNVRADHRVKQTRHYDGDLQFGYSVDGENFLAPAIFTLVAAQPLFTESNVTSRIAVTAFWP
jgi:hypothetical protein